MERSLAESLRPSAEELRREGWALLEQSKLAPDRQVRRELRLRAFELAQLATQLDRDASAGDAEAGDSSPRPTAKSG